MNYIMGTPREQITLFPEAAVSKEFVLLCRKLGLFRTELVAIDGTKFKASNARDHVHDKQQLYKTIQRINGSITQYLQQLDENDAADEKTHVLTASSALTKEELQKSIAAPPAPEHTVGRNQGHP